MTPEIVNALAEIKDAITHLVMVVSLSGMAIVLMLNAIRLRLR